MQTTRVTITEALAEIKTIGKRIGKKREFIAQYLMKQEFVKDPLEKDGGSEKALREALQGIADLDERLVRIRAAIQRSNLETRLTVNGRERSVTDWLTWRKEVAPGTGQMLDALRANVARAREQVRTKGLQVGSVGVTLQPQDIVVFIGEKDIAERSEELEATLGALDGKLSLNNATTVVDIA